MECLKINHLHLKRKQSEASPLERHYLNIINYRKKRLETEKDEHSSKEFSNNSEAIQGSLTTQCIGAYPCLRRLLHHGIASVVLRKLQPLAQGCPPHISYFAAMGRRRISHQLAFANNIRGREQVSRSGSMCRHNAASKLQQSVEKNRRI